MVVVTWKVSYFYDAARMASTSAQVSVLYHVLCSLSPLFYVMECVDVGHTARKLT